MDDLLCLDLISHITLGYDRKKTERNHSRLRKHYHQEVHRVAVLELSIMLHDHHQQMEVSQIVTEL